MLPTVYSNPQAAAGPNRATILTDGEIKRILGDRPALGAPWMLIGRHKQLSLSLALTNQCWHSWLWKVWHSCTTEGQVTHNNNLLILGPTHVFVLVVALQSLLPVLPSIPERPVVLVCCLTFQTGCGSRMAAVWGSQLTLICEGQ